MTGRFAVAGALAGAVLAVVLTVIFDPAEGSGSTAYEGGARFGEIARYLLLGAAGGACLGRLRAGARENGVHEPLIGPYCACLYRGVARDDRMAGAEAVLRAGGRPPAWVVRVTERCVAQLAPS